MHMSINMRMYMYVHMPMHISMQCACLRISDTSPYMCTCMRTCVHWIGIDKNVVIYIRYR